MLLTGEDLGCSSELEAYSGAHNHEGSGKMLLETIIVRLYHLDN